MSDPIDQEIRILRAIFWSERDPEGRAFVPLADAYLRKGSPDEAISLLEDGLGRHPEFASAHMVAARAYRSVGARGAVHRALGSVLELDPGNASALRMKGELAEAEGNMAVAMTSFREAVERNPDYEDLPGRIERLALGMSALEPTDPELPDRHDSGADPDTDMGDPDLIDFPLDTDAAFSEAFSEAFSTGDAPEDAPEDDLPGGLVDLDADVDAAVASDDDVSESEGLADEPLDAAFAIDDFPVDESAPSGESDPLEGETLIPDTLEFAPELPSGEETRAGGHRMTDLAAHEALLAERGAERGSGRTDEGGFGTAEALTPDEAEADDEDDPTWHLPSDADGPRGDSGLEPLPVTRTLGELYARQGLTAQAVGVFEALLERNPDDASLQARLSELRAEASGGELPVHGSWEHAGESGSGDLAPGDLAPDDLAPDDLAPDDLAPDDFESDDFGAVDAESDDAAGVGFRVAEQPVGSWFQDLLAWAPGAIPVEHLAPGAVPIASLAPLGMAGRIIENPSLAVATEPESGAEPGARPHAVASEPIDEPEHEPVDEPADDPVDEPAAELVDGSAGEPVAESGSVPGAAPSVASREADPSREPDTPREDGFEGLDDFQDWLRSLDR